MRKFLRIAIVAIVVLIALGATGFFLVYRATQHEPEFYVLALDIEPQVQELAGDELEKNVLDLRNEVRRDGDWQAHFTDTQINGWLASDLPEKYPKSLPPNVSAPRVAIGMDLAQVAFRFQSERFSSVISLGFSIQLTGRRNEIAIRMRGLHAGALPLPAVEKWKHRLNDEVRRAGVPLKWEKIDGDDVAVISLPQKHEHFKGQRLLLETIELRDGAIYLAGSTEPNEESSTQVNLLQTAELPTSKKTAVQR